MKRFAKIIITGVCLGIALAIFKEGFQIDKTVFWRGYWTAAPIIVIAVKRFLKNTGMEKLMAII